MKAGDAVIWRGVNRELTGVIESVGWMPDGKTDLYFIRTADNKYIEATIKSLQQI